VGEDVPNGRRPRCRAEPIGAGRRIERFEYLQVCKLVVEAEAALLDELHSRQRCDRLGHGGDAEHRVGRERAPGRDVCHAEGALVEHAPAIGDQRDHARHILALNRTAQRRVDARVPRRIRRTQQARLPMLTIIPTIFRFMKASANIEANASSWMPPCA
jgi:hypothetical protein